MKSIDPALLSSHETNDIKIIDNLRPDKNSVYIFDFDGVISSKSEDDIYKLPPNQAELDLLDRASNVFNIKCKTMDIQYQRHLLYQAAAWKLNIPIERGPAFNFFQTATTITSVFILTARSGWYAIERLRTFLKDNSLIPIEIFHVGRVVKDRQISLICEEFCDTNIIYVDDSLAHLHNAAAMYLPNLQIAWCTCQEAPYAEQQLRDRTTDIIKLAISKWK